jgi:ribosomal protein S6
MRNYDLTVFFDVANGEEEAKKLHEKLIATITKKNGKIYKDTYLGKVPLVSTFKKHSQAYGARIQYAATNEELAALEKEYQINEGIIRQLNSRMEHILSEEEIAEVTKG